MRLSGSLLALAAALISSLMAVSSAQSIMVEAECVEGVLLAQIAARDENVIITHFTPIIACD